MHYFEVSFYQNRLTKKEMESDMTLTAMRTLISTLQEEDYRTFVKALISVETENMNEEELDMMYYKFMEDDNDPLINPAFY